MNRRRKNMWMMFGDYLILLIIQAFTLLAFSWLLDFAWGAICYSAICAVVVFFMPYTRAHKAAVYDLKNKEQRPNSWGGVRLVLPFFIVTSLIALFYVLLDTNVLPFRDVVLNTLYQFPDDAPRVETQVFLIDTVSVYIRIFYAPFIGFMQGKTPHGVLFLLPVLYGVGACLGYFAGLRGFYLGKHLFRFKDVVVEKFNE